MKRHNFLAAMGLLPFAGMHKVTNTLEKYKPTKYPLKYTFSVDKRLTDESWLTKYFRFAIKENEYIYINKIINFAKKNIRNLISIEINKISPGNDFYENKEYQNGFSFVGLINYKKTPESNKIRIDKKHNKHKTDLKWQDTAEEDTFDKLISGLEKILPK